MEHTGTVRWCWRPHRTDCSGTSHQQFCGCICWGCRPVWPFDSVHSRHPDTKIWLRENQTYGTINTRNAAPWIWTHPVLACIHLLPHNIHYIPGKEDWHYKIIIENRSRKESGCDILQPYLSTLKGVKAVLSQMVCDANKTDLPRQVLFFYKVNGEYKAWHKLSLTNRVFAFLKPYFEIS